jgi:hypothetical protein
MHMLSSTLRLSRCNNNYHSHDIYHCSDYDQYNHQGDDNQYNYGG